MKHCKYAVIVILIICLLAAMAGCGKVKVSESYYPDSGTASGEAPVQTAPPLSEGAAAESRIAGNFMTDNDGTLYTTLADVPEDSGIVYLYDLLPADTGYVYAFLPSDGIIYAVVRTDMMTLDVADLYAYDLADGTATLLDDNCSGICSPVLAGDMLYYTDPDSNLLALDLNTGKSETVLTGVETMFAAEGGFLYYSRYDGVIYRNDSTMNAEYRILEGYTSMDLFVSDNGLCSVGYGSDTSVPVLQFRDVSGNLLSEQPLADDTVGICQQGDTLYAVQPTGTLVSYSIDSGSQLDSVEFPDAAQVLSLLYVSDTTAYYLRLEGGQSSVASAELASGASAELGTALIF